MLIHKPSPATLKAEAKKIPPPASPTTGRLWTKNQKRVWRAWIAAPGTVEPRRLPRLIPSRSQISTVLQLPRFEFTEGSPLPEYNMVSLQAEFFKHWGGGRREWAETTQVHWRPATDISRSLVQVQVQVAAVALRKFKISCSKSSCSCARRTAHLGRPGRSSNIETGVEGL